MRIFFSWLMLTCMPPHAGCTRVRGRQKHPHTHSMLSWMTTLEQSSLTESSSSRCGVSRRRMVTNAPHVKSAQEDDSAWLLPIRNRNLGISYAGESTRLRCALNKLISNQPFVLSMIGGSVTEGNGGTKTDPSWPVKLHMLLQQLFPKNLNITLKNGARGATQSSYMSYCFSEHVPKNADVSSDAGQLSSRFITLLPNQVILIEYAVNDPWQGFPNNTLDNKDRRAFEKLVRLSHDWPKRPAVIILNYYSWWKGEQFQGYPLGSGPFWSNAEHQFDEFSHYYSVPTLSLKAAVYRLFLQNLTGFQVGNQRVKSIHYSTLLHVSLQVDSYGPPTINGTEHRFYKDVYHPHGATGHRVMAELVLHQMLAVVKDLLRRPLTLEDEALQQETLPRPMLKGNHHSQLDMCHFAERFNALVSESGGWSYIDEGTEGRPKLGWVSSIPGSRLVFKLSTFSGRPLVKSQQAKNRANEVMVNLAVMESYEQMGVVNVSCLSGCDCETQQRSMTIEEKKSPIVLWSFPVGRSHVLLPPP